ncbi:unnamed protein product [Cladocopium goreaui]|uniref:Leucine-rich repeat-containing protein 49 (Tubulin polyglutamylase complex subunit 4) (PGs4) (p79) n=1 Tax=Cladocopium goreaui TaxID=2562237 RepID=A0A9P1DDK3_9DINO|nr:unnamed protein product [Cladocopium goreaui]
MGHRCRYSSLGSEVFFAEYGSDWTSYRSARNRRRIDFSGPKWSLETLVGPESGLMHKQFIREHIETLNLAKNKLTDISCLNAMKDTRTFEFRKLQILNASRNMLTHVKLVNASLTEINLSHNELTKLPDFSSLSQLSKLLLSHNNIDDKLEQFGDLQKLRVLDLSSNKFSWRPTFFRKQMSHLERIHLEEFKLWPNPFAEGFKEYQFITAVTLSSLTSLDGFGIDSDLRFQLRVQADQLHMNTADFSVFDVRVEVPCWCHGWQRAQRGKKMGVPKKNTISMMIYLLFYLYDDLLTVLSLIVLAILSKKLFSDSTIRCSAYRFHGPSAYSRNGLYSE